MDFKQKISQAALDELIQCSEELREQSARLCAESVKLRAQVQSSLAELKLRVEYVTEAHAKRATESM